MNNQPLSCEIEGDELVIRIGIDTLAFAGEQENGTEGPVIGNSKVLDVREWAKDVRIEIENEDEAGNSLLTRMLDKAMSNARDNGSTALSYPPLTPPVPHR